MADERNNYEAPATVESTDRGLFDFMKKKDDDVHKAPESEGVTSGIEKVHVSEPECRKEEEEVKHGSLLEKLQRSDSSSSSSDEEGDDEEKKRKRKEKKEKKAGLKEKIQEKLGGGHHKDDEYHHGDTNVPIEKVHVEEVVYSEPSYTAPAAPDHYHQGEEEKKGGFLDKIKDKLPGQNKNKAEDHEVAAPVVAEPCVEEEKEKKGFLDKIKDKIPGFHSKTDEEKKEHEEKKEGY